MPFGVRGLEFGVWSSGFGTQSPVLVLVLVLVLGKLSSPTYSVFGWWA
jgi:hypothetical protein